MVGHVFLVRAVIENKPKAKDPEGDTIHKELVKRSGFDNVRSLRTGKILSFEVMSSSEKGAKETVEKICEENRIFNPAAHTCRVYVEGLVD